jgi:hypothetical protein
MKKVQKTRMKRMKMIRIVLRKSAKKSLKRKTSKMHGLRNIRGETSAITVAPKVITNST